LNLLWRYDADPLAPGAGVTIPPRGTNPQAGPADAGPRSNSLAMASLALNVFCLVGNVAAIVAGVLALRQIARSNGTLGGRALAIAGIALGIAGLGMSWLAYSMFLAKGSG
jgi:hypothetical protein